MSEFDAHDKYSKEVQADEFARRQAEGERQRSELEDYNKNRSVNSSSASNDGPVVDNKQNSKSVTEVSQGVGSLLSRFKPRKKTGGRKSRRKSRRSRRSRRSRKSRRRRRH